MSDPVTNIDIEDVLSSIRRLVADVGRDVPRPVPATDRLVLTPALRVTQAEAVVVVADAVTPPDAAVEQPGTFAPEAVLGAGPEPLAATAAPPLVLSPAAAVSPDTTPAPHSGAVDRLAATIAELEAALGVGTGEWEPDGSEVHPALDWPAQRAEESPVFRARAGMSTVVTPAPEAAAESAPAVAPEEVPPSSPAPDVAAESHATAPVETAPVVTAPVETAPVETDSAMTDAPPAFHTTRTAPAAATAAAPVALRLAPDPVPPNPAPSDPALSDNGGLAKDLAATPDWQEGVTPELAAYLQEETVIDEEMLRALVIDIVRQELQGALGERITRNVRKLVRREIYRVLSSEEFS